MKTRTLKKSEIDRKWHLIDAKKRVLGKVAVEVANILSGKDKVNYSPNMDNGDYVVVVNSEKVLVTGGKGLKKKYYRYSGYPGGLREETLGSLLLRKPEEVIRLAVSGMLARNKLHDRRMARFYIYKGEDHPHQVQLGGNNAQS